MMRLNTRDEDGSVDGVFFVFTDEEIEKMRTKNAAFIEPEDGLPWIVVANEEDDDDFNENSDTNDPLKFLEWLRRGEEKEWPPPRLAKRKTDYEQKPEKTSPVMAPTEFVSASFFDAAITGPMGEDYPDRITLTMGGGHLDKAVGLDIMTKQRADKIISTLITLRNSLWPVP